MKQILIMRHAKSSWSNKGLKDFDRPLNNRGTGDAALMGKFVKKTGYIPDQICSSPAARARQTTELFCSAASLGIDSVKWDDNLYYGTSTDYLNGIRSFGSKNVERVMLVGHNPLVENTVGLLCGNSHNGLLRMPTAALVCFEFLSDSWKNLDGRNYRIKWFVIPKLLKAG